MLVAGLLAFSAATQELSWRQLVQHPETWPAQFHLAHNYDFQSGAGVNPGDVPAKENLRATWGFPGRPFLAKMRESYTCKPAPLSFDHDG